MLKAEAYLTVLYLWTSTFRSARRHALTHARAHTRTQASARLEGPLMEDKWP